MPIVATLRDSEGRPVVIADPNGGTCDAAGELDRVIPGTDTRYRLLSTIDPYGTTVFASQRVPDLLQELRQLATERLTAVENPGLARLMALVGACGLGLGLYVQFEGD